jgi:hypothetical protein
VQPQVIQSHDPGYHNSDLERSTLRVIEGGSWRKQRIVCLIPAGDMLPTRTAMALWALAFPPNQGVHRVACQGMEVGDA